MPRPTAPLLALALATSVAACSTDQPTTPARPLLSTGNPVNTGSQNPYTLAVIGDTPYSQQKLDSLPLLVDLINRDPKVDVVVHLGDIKTGKNTPCSDAWFTSVFDVFTGFKDPFVYTPGDNEWTDCHVQSKNNGFYLPTERLAFIRSLFFPVPGQTLGGRKKQVLTQADDPANSAYVENVMWYESRTLFATANITGSNNDLVPWGAVPALTGFPTQAEESAARAQANAAWIDRAFDTAIANDAAAVVLMFQADMWDVTEPTLAGFDALVQQIGTRAAAFGKPVLLLEGDSHLFRIDHPFTASDPLFSVHANTPVAPNVTRIVVEGSTNRTEYLRLTIDPQGRTSQLFTAERVPLQ